jgi:hypothetical protein
MIKRGPWNNPRLCALVTVQGAPRISQNFYIPFNLDDSPNDLQAQLFDWTVMGIIWDNYMWNGCQFEESEDFISFTDGWKKLTVKSNALRSEVGRKTKLISLEEMVNHPFVLIICLPVPELRRSFE